MSYRTKSSLSSRLLFEKLIDWVIHVDIVYQCWKNCDKAVSCKHITEGFELELELELENDLLV